MNLRSSEFSPVTPFERSNGGGKEEREKVEEVRVKMEIGTSGEAGGMESKCGQ